MIRSTKPNAIVLLSGGVDSSTLLYQLAYEDYDVTALSVDYGQRHVRELAAAEAVAHRAGVPLMHTAVGRALAPLFAMANSSQVGRQVAVPFGHYAAETMKATIVPNRNMLLLSIAGALAEAIDARVIAYAAHAGDHPIYPDCRPEFYASLNEAFGHATEGRVALVAPFGRITKADIVARAHVLRVPLALTYSCYMGGEQHCGRCGTCVERREAFQLAGVDDPTRYEDVAR